MQPLMTSHQIIGNTIYDNRNFSEYNNEKLNNSKVNRNKKDYNIPMLHAAKLPEYPSSQ